MPDAKSLLPGRAFRSEHAQLRPEPHSIASHGPDPMDPLQTTRMRNGVLYAAEWPCCHDPLRLSLGSEDPFYYTTHAFGARGCAHPHPHPGGAVGAPAARAECVRLPRARGGVRPTPFRVPFSLLPLVPPRTRSHASARGVASSPKQTSVSFSPRRTVPTPPRRPSANPRTLCVCPLLPPPALTRPRPHTPRWQGVLHARVGSCLGLPACTACAPLRAPGTLFALVRTCPPPPHRRNPFCLG